jgi:hypothetical protein
MHKRILRSIALPVFFPILTAHVIPPWSILGLFAVYFNESAAELPSALVLRVFISSFAIPIVNILLRLSAERISKTIYLQNSKFYHRSAYYFFTYGPFAYITTFGIPGE